jgi:hypothetical protein
VVQRLAVRLEDLAKRGNLQLATWKAAQGKAQRPAVARFLADLDGQLAALAADIQDGSAPRGRMRRFTIHDPKRRVIHAACFADRVLHHAILNLTEPAFERALVASSFACRPGRGVHASVQHVQRLLQRWPWVVQVDVAGYFPSIEHARLRALLARRFKGAGFLALMDRILAAGTPDPAAAPGRGLPIGALTSQHLANAFLDRADRFLLETCRAEVRGHARYMDDIVFCCDSRAAAQATLARLRSFLADELGLALKPGVLLQPSRWGLQWCGHRITPGLVRPSARKLARYRVAAQRLVQAERQGAAEADLQRAHDAALATLAHTQSLHWRQGLWAGAEAPAYDAPQGCDA